jgi:hypothetical protein
VDRQGNAYVVGSTTSTDFPLQHPLQDHLAGKSTGRGYAADAFVVKISADGSKLLYSTYLGGSGDDSGEAIALDAAGNAYVTGEARSADFPLAHPLQATMGGDGDAFIAKISTDGSHLLYSTFLGGTKGETGGLPNPGKSLDSGAGIAVDGAGNAYITGDTSSPDFPLAKPLYATFNGGVQLGDEMTGAHDAFVTELNADGSALVFSTFLGGNAGDAGRRIGLDAVGSIYVSGTTTSPDFPLARPLQKHLGGGAIGITADVFVAKLTPGGAQLDYSTYLGGSDGDSPGGMVVDTGGIVYLAGTTSSKDFPLSSNPFQSAIAIYSTAFLLKIADDAP